VINFAHGQVGAVAAVVLGVMVQQWGVPYWTAFVAVLALGAGLSALVEVTVVRRLRAAPPLMTLVATLGVAQFLLSVTATLSGGLTSGRQFPQPTGLPTTDFGALRLTPAIMAMLALGPLALAGLMTLATCVAEGIALNLANIIALPLLFGVGVAFNIYFVMAWRAGETAPLQSSLMRAVVFSALTTATAFGALWLSSHPGTASMGRLLMISLGWELLVTLLFRPALLAVPPRQVSR
jgi:hypothetical protein